MNIYPTQDPSGEKIAVDISDNPDLETAIRLLPLQQTHRTERDTDLWVIDCNQESIELFEQYTGVDIPREYKPYTSEDEVLLKSKAGYTQFVVDNPNNHIDEVLQEEFSYEHPDAEYTPRFKSGDWDGIIHLYNRRYHAAPIGLLQRAVNALESHGYDVACKNLGDRSGQAIAPEWKFEHDLRPYQQDAINAVHRNHGGIVALPTGTGKTVTAMRLIYEIQQRTVVFVHTQELLYQWADQIRDTLGIEPGLIGDGNWSEGPVTVAIMQTLISRGPDRLDGYGVAIFDECHRTSAAENMHEIGMALDVDFRIGLSATPWRRIHGEEMKIEAAIGGTAHTVTAEDMIQQGFLAEPEFTLLRLENPTKPEEYMDYHKAYETCIELCPVRNQAVAQTAIDLANDGHKVLINVNRIAQGVVLKTAIDVITSEEDAIREIESPSKQRLARENFDNIELEGVSHAEFLHSGTENRADMVERFEGDNLPILVSTLLKEGVDIPDITAIVLADGIKSDISNIQTIGRALRPHNGQKAQIVDFIDNGKFFSYHTSARQKAFNSYYGTYYDPDVKNV